jgi:hypothetical protein
MAALLRETVGPSRAAEPERVNPRGDDPAETFGRQARADEQAKSQEGGRAKKKTKKRAEKKPPTKELAGSQGKAMWLFFALRRATQKRGELSPPTPGR